MEKFNSSDKVNILIGFYDDNGIITKENIFFKKDIEIEEYNDVSGLFYTEPIEDIKPINYSGYFSISGYYFEYFKPGNLIQFNTGYNAFVYLSKKSYEDMKKDFLNELTADCQKEIDRLEEKIKENKKQIDIFNSIKD